MSIKVYFDDFIAGIRLTATQKSESQRGHKTLRERLENDDNLKDVIVSTFLQGSYRRSTAVRPSGEKRADVDVIVVTNLDRTKVTPKEALEKFETFAEKHYKGKWHQQGRSIGIELSYVDLDIVVTSAPSEVDEEILKSESVRNLYEIEDLSDWMLNKSWVEPQDLIMKANSLNEALRAQAQWKNEPLWIPDRDAGKWEETDPLAQIRWTWDKNKTTNKHYVNVVKALKWWRIIKLADLQYPKGYPIEHAIGDCCPDDITSVEEGVVKTMEAFVSNYRTYRRMGLVPSFEDRGVPKHNVWHRITKDDFVAFYDSVEEYSKVAREAYDLTNLRKKTEKWREVFGNKFPLAPDDGGNDQKSNSSPTPVTGFSNRVGDTNAKPERFA